MYFTITKTHSITGCPLLWCRDMALVGGATSATVPALVHEFTPSGYPLMAAVIGVVTGALLGLAMPRLLDRVRGRISLPILVLGSVMLGCFWGGATGALAGAPFGIPYVVLGLVAGGLAGAAQFGWWWFPYTVQTVRGGRTWPMLVAAVLALPFVTVVSIGGTGTLLIEFSNLSKYMH